MTYAVISRYYTGEWLTVVQQINDQNLFLMNVKIFEEQYAQAARNILLKSYHTKITICRIAEEVGVSESTLKRAFKNCFNIGVYEFQVMLRMEKAKEYLLEGGKSIKYVTRQVGYRRQSAFSRRFREYVGVSPLAWVNMNRNREIKLDWKRPRVSL